MDGNSPDDNSGDLLTQFCAAAAADLLTLASLHHIEADDALLIDLNVQGFPDTLGLKLTQLQSVEAISFMRQALSALTAPLRTEQHDELAADYAAIYLNHDYSASPYESVWLDEENLIMQAPMFQVREFYRRHGLGVADWRNRSDDHLVVELLFIANLLQNVQVDALMEAASFMDEHLLRWLPRFGERVAKRGATPFYAAAAWLTWKYCDELRDVLADILGEARPGAEEIDARMKVQSAPAEPLKFMPGTAPSW